MDWVAHFKANRANQARVPWWRGVGVEAHLREPLIRSLQRFQMGESGDGSHLKKVAARSGDRRYVEAIALFVEEEQRHAALMANVLHGLGAPLLTRHWSDAGFRLLCLASGLHVELMVLLVAEIVAKRYFRLLYESTSDPVVRAVCAQIRHDEEGHIAFHCDTLRSALSRLPLVAQRPIHFAWRLFFGAVCLLVVYDHRRLLRAAGMSLGQFHSDCLRIFDGTTAAVFAPTSTTERVAA